MSLKGKQKMWNSFVKDIRLPFLMNFHSKEASLLENLTFTESRKFKSGNFTFFELKFQRGNDTIVFSYGTGELVTRISIFKNKEIMFSTIGRTIFRGDNEERLNEENISILTELITIIVGIVNSK